MPEHAGAVPGHSSGLVKTISVVDFSFFSHAGGGSGHHGGILDAYWGHDKWMLELIVNV